MVLPHHWKGHISISSLLPKWHAEWPSALFGVASSQLQWWLIKLPPLHTVYSKNTSFLSNDHRPCTKIWPCLFHRVERDHLHSRRFLMLTVLDGRGGWFVTRMDLINVNLFFVIFKQCMLIWPRKLWIVKPVFIYIILIVILELSA